MQLVADSFTPKPKARPLRDFSNQLARVEYSNPRRAYQLIDELMEHIDEYQGSPDLWHNIAMVASRINHPGRLKIIRVGLAQWPNDVDLLCDDLQFCYGSELDLQRANELWSKLETMDEATTGPFWRFWVYGAIYNARMGRVQEGLRLLDRGILAVKRDGLMDVFRAYRSVLVDHVPRQALLNERDLISLHSEILEILEAKLRLGIRLGIENGYVLALELARLYQEMAGADFFEAATDEARPGEVQSKVNQKLRRALDILHLAECLYTGDPNHPIQEIYERRINILMPLHEYDEALKLLLSIPPNARLEEQRIARDSMRRFATLKTGGSLEANEAEADSQDKVTLEEALKFLFGNDGENLEDLVRANPPLQPILLRIAAKLDQT